MRNFLSSYMPSDLFALLKDALNDANIAEKLRHKLYYTYMVGDRPGQDPELDGQNGFTQFCVLGAKLDIPIIRLFAPKLVRMEDPVRDQNGKSFHLRTTPRTDESSMLAVRAFRTKWPPARRITYDNRRYKLIAMMIGSEHCGHQIATSTCDGRVCRWALADSDMRQNGIGPMFWSIPQMKGETKREFKMRWRKMWDDIVPVTVFGRKELCDLNPVNRPSNDLERFAKQIQHRSEPGVVNTDYIYLHIPDMPSVSKK